MFCLLVFLHIKKIHIYFLIVFNIMFLLFYSLPLEWHVTVLLCSVEVESDATVEGLVQDWEDGTDLLSSTRYWVHDHWDVKAGVVWFLWLQLHHTAITHWDYVPVKHITEQGIPELVAKEWHFESTASLGTWYKQGYQSQQKVTWFLPSWHCRKKIINIKYSTQCFRKGINSDIEY